MKRLALFTLVLALNCSPALAGDPAGDWMVEDGSAKIRIAICEGSLWGIVGWEKSPGKDLSNPSVTRSAMQLPRPLRHSGRVRNRSSRIRR